MERMRVAGMLKKGIIFSIDALLALLVAAFFIFAILSARPNAIDSSPAHIEALAMDTLAALEKKGLLADAVQSGSADAVSEAVDNILPKRICSTVSVNTLSEAVMAATRQGCTAGNSLSIARRSFMAGNGHYYALLELWYP
jgi:hypothetical protein